ncbi:hypothetical protein ACFVJ5_07005 [Nocardia sp. NPDC127606]|uniref:hypothetical protein n=1 Tax=Nocardia sp. NPDC127606 TaxID=3345406 RepID=UPI00363FAE32
MPLVEVLVAAPNPPTVLTRISRNNGAALLRELAVRAHTEPLTHALVNSLGRGYAVQRLRELLVHAEILPAREELLDRVERWLDDTLVHQSDHITTLVRPYATWHVLRRVRQRARRRPVTTNSATYNRSQIQIAINLLTWLDHRDATLAELTQPDLEQWLLESPRYHSFIAGFIGWARARKLCGPLLVPSSRSADPDLGLPEHQRWAELERCIRDPALPHDVRAAGILVLLYRRALTECAELTTDAIEQRGDTTNLRLPEISVEMPPTVAAVFAALIESSAARPFQRSGNAPYLFPSEMPGQPTRGFVLARKLRAHGINALPARHAARAA